MSKVLVTGGAGFIGSAMTNKLIEKKFEVKMFDLGIQFEKNSPPQDVEIYKGSILDKNDLMNAMEGCDYVVHLAAALGVRKTEKERLNTLNINIQGTKNVLDACVKDHVKKIVFSSSSEVYGDQTKLPISETNPFYPKSIYAITKLVGEEYLNAFNQRYGLEYSILRFFNIYGPGQVAEFVMPKFIHLVKNNTPPKIYGQGNQIRAFCYIDDAVEGAYLALKNKDANSEIFNIGNDKEPITMKDLFEKIIKISEKDLKPEFVPMEKSDRTEKREIIKRIPDISKAREILDYEPNISLDEGIRRTIEQDQIRRTWAIPTM
ncbi:MAG: NAD-dependent epimerase/dehydratase family protein [Thermoplasmatales archaeon]|nr:NAD-dependent epimerase/dehydratase family protein [Thermoplasmatales archaeon]MCK4995383.1 NAD-dependent epimerase/dehydratase family protein [Thermoplasmatales archaeon]